MEPLVLFSWFSRFGPFHAWSRPDLPLDRHALSQELPWCRPVFIPRAPGDATHTTQHLPQRAASPRWKTGPNGVLQEALFTLWLWRLTSGSRRGTLNGWETFPTRGRFSGEGSAFSVNRGHESAAPEVAESLLASRLPWVTKFYLNKAASKMAKAPLPSRPRRRSLPVPVSIPLPRAGVCGPLLAGERGGSGFSPANG